MFIMLYYISEFLYTEIVKLKSKQLQFKPYPTKLSFILYFHLKGNNAIISDIIDT